MENNKLINNGSQYWYENLGILLDMDKLDQIFPKSYMSYPDKLNSLVRLSIYLGLILSVIYKNYLFFYIPIIVMGITILLKIYRDIDKSKKIEKLSQPDLEGSGLNVLDGNPSNLEPIKTDVIPKNPEVKEQFKNCVAPSLHNPFMNAMPYDDRNRSMNCKIDTNVKENIEKYFNHNLYRGIDDIFNKSHGQREFYTMPSTTYPNYQDNFARWCYSTPTTCKEGNGNQCVANNQERLNQSSYQFPYLY
jgi:hypothetical protein